jgi:hypothetical protein
MSFSRLSFGPDRFGDEAAKTDSRVSRKVPQGRPD